MSVMLFKKGFQLQWEGLDLDFIEVEESAIEEKLNEGWKLHPYETKESAKKENDEKEVLKVNDTPIAAPAATQDAPKPPAKRGPKPKQKAE